MAQSRRRGTSRSGKRAVLYQLCRAGERFEVGDGPIDLTEIDSLLLGRGDPQRSRMGKVYVDDPWMSSKHARLVSNKPRSAAAGNQSTGNQSTGNHTGDLPLIEPLISVEDMGSTNGVLVNCDRVQGSQVLEHGDLVETGRTFWLYFLEPLGFDLPIEPYAFGSWNTWCPKLVYDLSKLEKRIQTKKNVLLTGPEGSGKGFLARTIHTLSGREGKLVHLDCAERKAKHLVFDLFGGQGRPGRLREADMGTLLLENIDSLPADVQERLTDCIKKGGFIPEGKTRRVSCDVRLVASTSGDTNKHTQVGILSRRFLEAVGQIHVELPSLADRRPDLGLLLDDFLARARGAPAFSREACRSVLMHEWHLNVRAFARVIESAAVLASGRGRTPEKGGRVELEHLPVEVVGTDALRALLPSDPQARPPSVQAPMEDAKPPPPEPGPPQADPEKTEYRAGRGTRSELLASSDDGSVPGNVAEGLALDQERSALGQEFEDPYLTDEIPAARVREEKIPAARVREEKIPAARVREEKIPAARVREEKIPAARVREEKTPAARVRADPLRGLGHDEPDPDHDDIEVTDPAAVAPTPSPARPKRPRTGMSPAVRALDPSDEPAPSLEERPPSAYFELQSVERSYANAVDPDLIVDALVRARGNVSAAARYLGKPRATLMRWMKEFQLQADDYRDG